MPTDSRQGVLRRAERDVVAAGRCTTLKNPLTAPAAMRVEAEKMARTADATDP